MAVKKKTNNGKNKKVVEELVNKLLDLMSVSAKAKVSEDKENEALMVEIESENEKGLLIGRHGETLQSLQALLGMMYRQKTGEWARVLVNVGDWREKQEEQLKELAHQAARRARETGQEQTLFNLNASQRRIIHLELANEKDIETESKGEGSERYLIIRARKQKD